MTTKSLRNDIEVKKINKFNLSIKCKQCMIEFCIHPDCCEDCNNVEYIDLNNVMVNKKMDFEDWCDLVEHKINIELWETEAHCELDFDSEKEFRNRYENKYKYYLDLVKDKK